MVHIFGIDIDGKMQAITSAEDKDVALRKAMPFVGHYRQLFMLRSGYNVQELVVSLTVGEFAPTVK